MKKRVLIVSVVTIIAIIITVIAVKVALVRTRDNQVKKNNEKTQAKLSDEERLLKVYNENYKITVIMEDNYASEEEIKKVYDKLKTKNYISNIEYISKEDALEKMKETFSDSEYLFVFDGYEGENNIFPVEYVVTIKFETMDDIKNSEYLNNIVEDLEQIENIEDIRTDNYSIGKIGKSFYDFYEKHGIDALEEVVESDYDLEVMKKYYK